jgi:calcium-dependent protein kinase
VLERCYNEKCDVWSLGVITYVLLSGEPPFGGESDIEILKSVLYGKLKFDKVIWKSTSAQAQNIIMKMMERNVDKRISMSRAMEDTWFREYLREREKEQVETNFVLNALMNMKKFKEVKEANIQNGVLVFIINFVSHSDNQN